MLPSARSSLASTEGVVCSSARCGRTRKKPDFSRKRAEDEGHEGDPVLRGGKAALGLPGQCDRARRPREGGETSLFLSELLRGARVRQGDAGVPRHFDRGGDPTARERATRALRGKAVGDGE